MRITPQMMMNQYQSNLNSCTSAMNSSMTKAYTYRAFDKPSEDPLAASQTYSIHSEITMNKSYLSNIQSLQSSGQTAESILQTVNSLLSDAYDTNTLEAINGTMNTSDRQNLADSILTMRDSLLTYMNSKYADSYLFGGANSDSTPFTVGSDGSLLYRGINVDTGENTNGASALFSTSSGGTVKTTQINFGKAIGAELNGYTITLNPSQAADSAAIDTTAKTITLNFASASPTKAELQTALQGLGTVTGPDGNMDFSAVTVTGNPSDAVNIPASGGSAGISNIVDLDALANENVFVDVGLGMATQADGSINPQTAYNNSLPGISLIGYGMTDGSNPDSAPKNLYSLMTKIAGLLNDTSLSSAQLVQKASPYLDSFKASQDDFTSAQTGVGYDLNFLTDTQDYLTNMSTNLSQKDNSVEFVDYSQAITDYMSQNYCYTAALQVGSKVLSQSLMDYIYK